VYYFLTFNGEKVGYMAVRVEGDVLFLSKFYLKKEFRGKGIARVGMNYFEDFCRQRHLKKIYLHVNRKNLGVIKIYEKLGLKNVGAKVTEMGHGFVMDDYVMEKTIS
ncbi:MAG: GNAT family N-acetyltransferase, partial [Verrucomicrobia bacterium]|nr:GNAT family N-acetyltransferase [Verrucomicrobiota bacterium]